MGAAMLTESAKLETGGGGRGGTPANKYKCERSGTPGPPIDYVSIGGPYNPTGPGDTESRRIIFVCRPQSRPAGRALRPADHCEALARRAYRRPVTAVDIDPLIEAFRGRPCRWRKLRHERRDGPQRDSGFSRLPVPHRENPRRERGCRNDVQNRRSRSSVATVVLLAWRQHPG